LFVVDQSNQLKVFAWEIKEGEYPVEKPVPEELLPGEVVVLVPAGSLFFAAAPIFEEELPEFDKAQRSVVIISLRGYDTVGSTFLTVLEKLDEELAAHESKLILVEVNEELWVQLSHTGHLYKLSRDQVYEATDQVAESIFIAYADAQNWVNE
jgi:SulP family sulfate permease